MLQFPEIDTPALLIEQATLQKNIVEMQQFADLHALALRPHIKTHKSAQIAHLQLKAGACGIAVAKLSEAEMMVAHRVSNIQVANQVVGSNKIARLVKLSEKADVSCAVDSVVNVCELSSAFAAAGRTLSVLIEIDTGLHRSGLSDFGRVRELSALISQLPGLKFLGLMTHAGHAYAASGPDEIARIAKLEGQQIVDFAQHLRAEGTLCPVLSVGSTPTARYSGEVSGITELRVGNYAFNDMVQVALGTVTEDRCALSVLATVISCPEADRAVIDAGSKALTTEQGAHGSQKVRGFGHVIGRTGTLARLSEEHGIIQCTPGAYSVGDRLRIIPNHACAVANLFDAYYVVDGNQVVGQLRIDARGCVT